MTSRFVRALISIGGCLLAGGATAADIYSPVTPEVQQVTTESGWTFSFAPYFWASGLSGDIQQFGLPAVDVDASFSDVFDRLDFAAMAIGEARYGPYSIFGDVLYTKLSGGTPRGILATDVELSTETFAGLIGAGYTVFHDSSVRSMSWVACVSGPEQALVSRCGVLVLRWKVDPKLDHFERAAFTSKRSRMEFLVQDTACCRHPLDVSGADDPAFSSGISVFDLALVDDRHSLETARGWTPTPLGCAVAVNSAGPA